jgi:hypothetical protein
LFQKAIFIIKENNFHLVRDLIKTAQEYRLKRITNSNHMQLLDHRFCERFRRENEVPTAREVPTEKRENISGSRVS